MTAWLARAAARERDQRGDRFPAMVDAGTMSAEEAEGSYAAWVAIADWLEHGRAMALIMGVTSWAEMELHAGRALIRTSDAAEAKPGDRLRIERRDAVASIYERIKAHRADIDNLNARLRAYARKEAA